jgi:hypothetical protein
MIKHFRQNDPKARHNWFAAQSSAGFGAGGGTPYKKLDSQDKQGTIVVMVRMLY